MRPPLVAELRSKIKKEIKFQASFFQFSKTLNMGSRSNYKNYSRSSGYSKRRDQLDSVRSMVRSSNRNDGTRPRKGQAAVPRSLGATVTSEMKYFDTERLETQMASVTTLWVSGTLFDPTNSIDLGNPAVAAAPFFCPQQGNGLNGRIGRKCHLYKIRINGTVIMPNQSNQTIADPSSKMRIILLVDKQTNGTTMSPSLFMSPGTAPATTINTFQNPQNFGRFQVLKEKVFVVNSGQLGNSGGVAPDLMQAGTKVHFKMNYVFKKPLLVNFNATNSGLIADIIDNSIHLICATDNVSLDPRVTYYSRACFKE